MANTWYTIIKPSVSSVVINKLKEFVRDIQIEEDGIRAWRGNNSRVYFKFG